MGRRTWTALLVGALAAAAPAAAPGAGLRGVADAFLLEAADTVALLDGVVPVPAQGRGAWFSLGQARLWGLPELPQAEAAAGLAWPLAGGCGRVAGAWERTGGDLLRIDRHTLSVGWRRGWELRLAAAREQLRVAGETVEVLDQWSACAGPDLAWGEAVHLSLRFWAILSPPRPGDRRLLPAGRAVLRVPGGAGALAWDRRGDGTPALGAEIGVALGGAAALAMRWDGASASLGPGCAVRLGPLLLRTSHLTHPALGLTHRFELTGGSLDAARR